MLLEKRPTPMKPFWLAVALLVFFAGGAPAATEADLYCFDGTNWKPASAATPCPVTATVSGTAVTSPAALTPVAGAQYGLTLAAATAITPPATATTAIVTVEGNSVRCTTTATTPTASVGMGPYGIGTILTVKLTSLAAFQCIQTAASATIDVEYFK